MSRCFPFPPSGVAGKSNDALIVSIKLQEEKQISIPDRVTEKVKSSHKKKDRKSDKKEKKKDLKEKRRDDKEKIQSHVASDKQKWQIEKLYEVELKGKQVSSEVVERSNLTEEHGMPIEPQHVSCSSDSTGNSGKRKRLASPDNSIQGNGNKLRIRLSSFKKKDAPCPSTSQVLPSPSVSQSDAILKVQEPVKAPNAAPHLVFPEKINLQTPSEEPSTSGRVESKEPVKKLSSHERKMIKKETLYNNLLQNLVPPTAMMELVVDNKDDEDDWLLGKKDEQRPPKKLKEGGDDLPCSVFASLQPGAHFLSDVGVYALPFTVPF